MPRYKLLAGLHVETGPDGHEHCYKAGDVFESNNPHHAVRRLGIYRAPNSTTNTATAQRSLPRGSRVAQGQAVSRGRFRTVARPARPVSTIHNRTRLIPPTLLFFL